MTQLLNSLVGLLSAHPALALVICFAVAFGEALLIVGLFVPSTTVLVGAGTLIGVGSLPFWPIFLATVAGSVAGDALSYWFGWHYDQRIRGLWPFSRYPQVLAQGEAFFARYGAMSIVIVRFIPGAKAVVPAIAAMAGMPPLRFTLINLASAFPWAGVHILPAIALGRGIRVAQLADPRLMLLMAIVAVVLVVAWFATRLAFFILLPRLDRLRRALVARLSLRPGWLSAGAVRVLENRDGLFVTFVLGLLVLATLRLLVGLLAALLFAPGLIRSDAAIAALLEGLRDQTVTAWMAGVSMLADPQVLVPAASLLILVFALRRQWGVAGTVLTAAAASATFEPLLRALFRLGPPGHVASPAVGNIAEATVVFGLWALFLARPLARRRKVAVYLAVVLLIALIASARIYLLIGRPSEVLAGLTFGAAVTLSAAFLLHGRDIVLPRRLLEALFGVLVVFAVPLHLATATPRPMQVYGIARAPVLLDRTEWLAGGGADLPPARVLLDGDYGEPMILQTDRPLAGIVAALRADGWRQSRASQTDSLLGAIFPTRGQLARHAPWPLTHMGRTPVATLTRDLSGQPGRRSVLRFWNSGVTIVEGTSRRPLLLASASGETQEPVTLGWTAIDPFKLDASQSSAIRSGLARALGVADPGPGPIRAPAP